MTRFCLRRLALPLLAVVCALLPLRAEAQLSRVGNSKAVIPGTPHVRGTDSAYDPAKNVFLVVYAYGPVRGIFLDASGNALTPYFDISHKPGMFAHYPRVIYGNGKFLVAWHEDDGPVVDPRTGARGNTVHVRTVAYETSTFGPDTGVGFVGPSGTWWEAAPDIAYSEQTKVYLVTWQSLDNRVYGRRLDANGQPIGSAFEISSGNGRDPSVAWNPNTNEFGVTYSGWTAQNATVMFARVRATDGAVLSRTLVDTQANAYITDTAFSAASGNFVITYNFGLTRVTEIGPAGQVIAHRVTTSVGGYDGLSIAYNPLSTTLLLAGHYTFQVGGFELNSRGVAITAAQELTNGAAKEGSFYPQVASAADKARAWSVTFSLDLGAAAQQTIRTGPAVALPTAAPPPSGLGSSTGGTPPPTASCGTPPSGMVCSIHGGFVPPNHPDAVKSGGSGGSTGGGTTPPAPPPPPPPPPATSCGTPPAGLVCSIYGGWVPANHPDAVKSGGSTGGGTTTQPPSPPPPPPTTSCGTPPAGMVCSIYGGFVPANHPDAVKSGPGSLPACTGAQLTGRPASGWVRLPSGAWVPESHELAPQGVCRG